ncbi:MAG: tripartite tricarboxylate transporter substrate binding protein [Pigmentiphaga sp.]|nr:tripartite tricarboxylate transporter substrate binding protein [Pigmentiphaga sp.]
MQTAMKTLAAGILGFSLAMPALAANADDFPTRPIQLIVPNSPGGAVDILARLLSVNLEKELGQTVIIDYKPGAGTVVGTDYVARAKPDGYTLGMVVTSHVINPSLRPNMPYDTEKDLTGVSLLASSQIVITASPKLGVTTLQEVIDMARKDPQAITYASPGSGSSMHLSGELLKNMTGIEMLHVPFKGSGPAYPEVMSGRVSLLIDPLFSSMPHIQGGNLVALAVTGAERSAAAPEVISVSEVVPGFRVESVFGVVAPAATPKPIVEKLSKVFAKVLHMPEVTKRLNEIGMEPIGNTPDEFNAYIHEEIRKWDPIVKASGAVLD